MNAIRRTHRPLALLLCAVFSLSGCRTTVKEHESQDAAPSVTIKAFWKDGEGEKRYVAGLFCQLALKKPGEASTLVAQGTTTSEGALVFNDLAPGHYRVAIRGPDEGKDTKEFTLREGHRTTLRLRVDATAGKTVKRIAKGIGEGLVFVALATGYLILVIATLSIEDDDDDDLECRQGCLPSCAIHGN